MAVAMRGASVIHNSHQQQVNISNFSQEKHFTNQP
jgi:hypothetical protein